jgi:hypothetical protein
LAVDGRLTGARPIGFEFGYMVFGAAANKFSFLKSHDGSKLLVQYRRKPKKKDDAISHDVIGMYVFDSKLNQLMGNDIKMPYTEQAMDNMDYHLNSEGIPHILARVRSDGSDRNYRGIGTRTDIKINHHIELLKIDIPAGKIKVTKIDAEGYLFKDIALYDDSDNNMICKGLYTQPGIFWTNTNGIFQFRFNDNGGISTKNFYEIPLEVINQYQNAGTQKENADNEEKGKAQFKDLDMKRLIVQEDNSIVLIGEQFYFKSYQRGDKTSIAYRYDDILITKINPNGDMAWMRRLPKRQTASSPAGGISFKHIYLEDKHYLVFLDNVKNMDLQLNECPAYHVDGRGGFLTAYGVDDATGAVNKISIFDTKNVDGGYHVKQYRKHRMVQLNKDEFIVEVYKGQKEDVMIKMKIK